MLCGFDIWVIFYMENCTWPVHKVKHGPCRIVFITWLQPQTECKSSNKTIIKRPCCYDWQKKLVACDSFEISLEKLDSASTHHERVQAARLVAQLVAEEYEAFFQLFYYLSVSTIIRWSSLQEEEIIIWLEMARLVLWVEFKLSLLGSAHLLHYMLLLESSLWRIQTLRVDNAKPYPCRHFVDWICKRILTLMSKFKNTVVNANMYESDNW